MHTHTRVFLLELVDYWLKLWATDWKVLSQVVSTGNSGKILDPELLRCVLPQLEAALDKSASLIHKCKHTQLLPEAKLFRKSQTFKTRVIIYSFSIKD